MNIMKERPELNELEAWELQYYTLHFNCTEEELKKAVELVGNSPDGLEMALGV
jgi:hypothetical protein